MHEPTLVAWAAPSLASLLGLPPLALDARAGRALLLGGALALGAAAAAAAAARLGPRLGAPAASKPFATFAAFYPAYLLQHRRRGTRALHAVGTAAMLAAAAREPALGAALAAAGAAGAAAFPLFRAFETGAAEALVAVAAYAATGTALGARAGTLAAGPAVAYFFAWVSHFFIERNTPATFIYPAFSLLADVRMLAECVTGRLSWGE